MTDTRVLPDTGIVGFTFGDGFEAIQRSMAPITRPPENESRRSTVSGPIAAASKPIPESIRDLL